MTPTSAIITGITPDKKNIVSILSIIQYSISQSGNCTIITDKVVLNQEYQYYEGIQYPGYIQPSLLKRDIDIYPYRMKTDLVIQGTARSEKKVQYLTVTLNCKGDKINFAHDIHVQGDRIVEKGFRGHQISDPEFFTEMPMRYDKSYGGTDENAEKKLADPDDLSWMKAVVGEDEDKEISEYSYPRNPSGKGYCVDSESLDGLSLPNLEFMKDQLSVDHLVLPLNQWDQRPYPASFDWFPHAWFPRVAFFGDFPETDHGGVPKIEIQKGILDKNLLQQELIDRPKHCFSQGAHPFLWQHRLKGNETIHISHMSIDGQNFLLNLPDQRPFIKGRFASKKRKKLYPELDLVFIETDKKMLTLLWRASVLINEKQLCIDVEKQCDYDVYL